MLLAIVAATYESLPAKVTRLSLFELVSRTPTPFVAALVTAAAGLAVYFALTRSTSSGAKSSLRPCPALKGTGHVFESKLLKREELTHNTLLLRFELPRDSNCLGLGAGKHIAILTGKKGDATEPEVRRSYTPVTTDSEQISTFLGASFDLIIKVYHKSPPKFPNGGTMSQRLAALRVGDKVRVTGPTGLFEYTGRGKYVRKPGEEPKTCKHLALIAGGTGITPMLQIMKHIAEDEHDATHVSLVYANSSIDDVLLYDELVFLGGCKNFNVWFTVSQTPPTAGTEHIPGPWKFSTGRIDKAMLQKHLPAPSGSDVAVLLCGPHGMINETCKPLLAEIGHAAENIVVL